MDANKASFLDLLGTANTQFVIPVYQRVYSWGERQCDDLWTDIMRAGIHGMPHFVGSVLYIPESGSTLTGIKKMLLIDGQQRMTTLSLIIAALVEWLEEDEDRASFLTDTRVSFLRKSYLFNNDDLIGDSRYKLVLSQDDHDTLFSIVGDMAMPKDCSELIVENYKRFRTKVRERSFDAKTLWTGLRNIQIIDTSLDPATDNAQLIFESMNSKGKPLTPIDLIRNYILMSLPNNEQTRLYEGYWHPIKQLFGRENEGEFNAFMWYWLWLKVPNRKPKEDEAYDEFKRFKEDDFEGDTEELLSELMEYAQRYANMFLGQETNPSLREAFGHIADLWVKPIKPLMLALYSRYDEGALSEENFLALCTYIESFLFRRSVCRRFTTGLNNFFAGTYHEIEKRRDVKTYVTAMLLVHGPSMTAYFPTDEDFAEQFKSRDCYHRFSKSRFYLERIENSHHPKEPIPSGKYQIEHVLPQTIESSPKWQEMLGEDWPVIHEQCCNTLGNLTLTGYNQEYSNRSFQEKLNLPDVGFKCSTLFLNKSIASKSIWDENTIEKRAELLVDDALKIWPYPKMDPDTVDEFRPKKGF